MIIAIITQYLAAHFSLNCKKRLSNQNIVSILLQGMERKIDRYLLG